MDLGERGGQKGGCLPGNCPDSCLVCGRGQPSPAAAAAAFPAKRSSPRGSPSSWVTLPRPAQRPAPPPTVLASPCGGCSLFGSRMARLLVGAAEQMQCRSPDPMCARNQQLWDPNTRARSGCGIRWGGSLWLAFSAAPSCTPFSFASLGFPC